ncbi:uncharacterized protein LOC131151094 [Malania oleifera]|uniref:uncharacterized protein LOC131151094 n=1 Tax=Malania oleifera TaxID=397392 RepID=UPI0025AEA04F|nr:uncharacterized protein LOC131151094 [Malania oleifera]
MGQAFRRASGRIRSSSLDTTPSSSAKKAIVDRHPAGPTDKVEISKAGENGGLGSDDISRDNSDRTLEERDPKYDAMLSQMVGRIRSKPGGKLEMDEAFVAKRYNRPMPKLRNTKPESSRYEEKSVPAGTLNVAQMRQIILLRQGKADDHDGPMEIHQIAKKFQIDAGQIQRILQYISLPPEDTTKQKNDQ